MRRARLVAGLAVGSMLFGCATTGGQHSPIAPANDKLNGDYDSGKVATVNRWIYNHGATVIWVNYPQKRRTGDGN